jgi:uncharacterized membrane protein (DUF485 family)
MAGLDHATFAARPEDEIGARRRARWGLVLFFLYLALYGGFMGLSAFAPATMRSTPFGGVTLAVSYGFGLIVAALGLALLYGWLCRTGQPSHPAPPGGQ